MLWTDRIGNKDSKEDCRWSHKRRWCLLMTKFGFVPGRGTIDAIFVVWQLQYKYLAVNMRLYVAFVDLEKAFDSVLRKVIWWALRKLGVEEWIMLLAKGMYANARSRVCVGECYSREFDVKAVAHQGPVLSPLLWRPCHASSALKFSGRAYYATILSSLPTRLRNVL